MATSKELFGEYWDKVMLGFLAWNLDIKEPDESVERKLIRNTLNSTIDNITELYELNKNFYIKNLDMLSNAAYILYDNGIEEISELFGGIGAIALSMAFLTDRPQESVDKDVTSSRIGEELSKLLDKDVEYKTMDALDWKPDGKFPDGKFPVIARPPNNFLEAQMIAKFYDSGHEFALVSMSGHYDKENEISNNLMNFLEITYNCKKYDLGFMNYTLIIARNM